VPTINVIALKATGAGQTSEVFTTRECALKMLLTPRREKKETATLV